jgi:hypothetical protein
VNVKQEGIKRKEIKCCDIGYNEESKERKKEVNVEQEDSKKEEERSVDDDWEDKKT